jgi:hypothetical protein
MAARPFKNLSALRIESIPMRDKLVMASPSPWILREDQEISSRSLNRTLKSTN